MNDGTPIIVKKKKVAAHSVHHGGSWKVAYADFVTAMMAFFMVMWIMGLSDQTKALIQGYFNDPLGFTKNEPKAAVNVVQLHSGAPKTVAAGDDGRPSESRSAAKLEEEAMKKLQEQIEEAVKGGGSDLEKLLKNVEFTITEEGLQIELIEASGAVFFDIGRATIRPEAAKLIRRMAPLIYKSNRGIVITGHTDARPYPSDTYDNMDLSLDRASAMRHLLRGCGIPSARFLELRGEADHKLRKPEDPYHYSNRRVTLLLPFKPLSTGEIGMPANDLKDQIQGVFRRPIDVAPERPDVAGDQTNK